MTTAHLELGFAGAADSSADAPHLSVDGMTPAGPNLSHWPGNRTPARFKADLSTGICLRFQRAPEAVQAEFLGDARFVVNDHYDTDGFASLLAILEPATAFAHEEVLLAAATTGDFQVFVSPRAFAVDRTVLRLADPERSPVADEFAGLSGADKSLARYRWLIANAAEVLRASDRFEPLWAGELAEIETQLDAALAGPGCERTVDRELGFAVVASREPMHRMVLNTVAGACRVLHVEHTPDGPLYRYHDRTESWFELVTLQPPRRRDLRPVAARLQELEGEPGPDDARWCADDPAQPIPELYHGPASEQAYGDVSRTRTPSRLEPDTVVRVLREAFEGPAG